MVIKVGGETFHKEPNLLEQIAFRDTWGRGNDSFLAMIYKRLILIATDLKEGKSEVVCEQGKLIKLSRSKEGVITRDVLTKRWTDWVDYWAVDFDYESRKEIIKVAKNFGMEGALPGTAAEWVETAAAGVIPTGAGVLPQPTPGRILPC